jgi:hypothetical protein
LGHTGTKTDSRIINKLTRFSHNARHWTEFAGVKWSTWVDIGDV